MLAITYQTLTDITAIINTKPAANPVKKPATVIGEDAEMLLRQAFSVEVLCCGVQSLLTAISVPLTINVGLSSDSNQVWSLLMSVVAVV